MVLLNWSSNDDVCLLRFPMMTFEYTLDGKHANNVQRVWSFAIFEYVGYD